MNQRGFTYIEAIAAVSMVGLAVLAATSMTAAHPVASARLAAQEDMLSALDALLEDVRAGAVPLRSGVVRSPIRTSTPVRLSLEVESSEIAGLVRVRAIVRAEVRGQKLERVLSTAIWSSS